jgi:mycofactocin system creatininase family protein
VNRLGELTGAAVGAAGERVLLVPAGSCEQHGPHLPLDTDTRIAVAVCEGLAADTDRVVVAPPIAVGASGEHAGFPGTLSIGTEVLTDVVVELVRSADRFAGVLVVNAHGGNSPGLAAAEAICTAEGRSALIHHVTFPAGDAHAGRTETSILLALRPDLVRMESAVPGVTAPIEQLMPRLRSEGLAAVTPTGVLGDPSGASGEEGRALLRRAVADALISLARLDPAGA